MTKTSPQTTPLLKREELADWIYNRARIRMTWRHWRLWSEAGMPTLNIPGVGLRYDPEAVWAWLLSLQGPYMFTHGNNHRDGELHRRRPRKTA